MIPEIGVMIGAYIFVSMLSLILRTKVRSENPAVRIFAVLAIALNALVCTDLLTRGSGSAGTSGIGALLP